LQSFLQQMPDQVEAMGNVTRIAVEVKKDRLILLPGKEPPMQGLSIRCGEVSVFVSKPKGFGREIEGSLREEDEEILDLRVEIIECTNQNGNEDGPVGPLHGHGQYLSRYHQELHSVTHAKFSVASHFFLIPLVRDPRNDFFLFSDSPFSLAPSSFSVSSSISHGFVR